MGNHHHHHGGDFTVGHKTSTATVTVERVNKNSADSNLALLQGERCGATGVHSMSNCPKSIRLDVFGRFDMKELVYYDCMGQTGTTTNKILRGKRDGEGSGKESSLSIRPTDQKKFSFVLCQHLQLNPLNPERPEQQGLCVSVYACHVRNQRTSFVIVQMG